MTRRAPTFPYRPVNTAAGTFDIVDDSGAVVASFADWRARRERLATLYRQWIEQRDVKLAYPFRRGGR